MTTEQDLPLQNASVQAWDRHLQKLTDNEKDLFQRCQQANYNAYIESIRLALSEQKENSLTNKIARLMEPIFITSRKYMAVARTAVQADPSPSALVLAGIVCVMQVSSGYLLYQEKLANLLSRMGQKADTLAQFGELCQDDEQVQQALVDVYGDILDFCREALKPLVDEKGDIKRGLKMFGKTLLKSFDESNFGHIAESFERNLKKFKDAALLCGTRAEAAFRDEQQKLGQHLLRMQNWTRENLSMSQGTLSQLHQLKLEEIRMTERKDKEKKKSSILSWLASTSFELDLDNKFNSGVNGTGQWLFKSEEYNCWKKGKESAALWIKGKHGCGKSVLASVALTEIRESTQAETAVAYFFCSSLQEKTCDPLELLGSLLRQLCEQQPTIDRGVENLFDQKGTAHTNGPSWKDTTTALNFVVANFSKVFLLCDGLDECRDSQIMSEFLLSLSQTEAAVVKVLILSRPDYDTLEEVFSGCPVVEMDNGANDEDIKRYIAKTLSITQVAARDERQLVDTQNTVFTKAEGMFLYVSLLAKDLQGSRTVNQLQTKLKSLPSGLDQVYAFSMQRIFNEPDNLQRKWALDMLFWATNAKRRLTRTEMLEAIVIEPGMENLDDGDRITRDRGLASLCGDLIRMDSEECYSLVHSSLKDYLLRLPLNTLRPFEEYTERQEKADYVMAKISLTYLLFSKFRDYRISTKRDLDDFRKDNPFFKYAATYFAHGLSTEAAENLQGLIMELLNCSSLRDLVLQAIHSDTFPGLGNATELILLSTFNLIDMAKSLPVSKSQLNCPSPFGLYPLDYALINRNKAICIWLLETGSSLLKLLPLHAAASYGWADVVDKLLLLKYDVNARDSKGDTPLFLAAQGGRVQAVERLLKETTVSVNSVNDAGETPLVAACGANHTDVAFQLLNAGAVTTAQRHNGWTALHLAAASNNVNMIKMLLQSGADIEAQAKKSNNWTPISVAAGLDAADAVQYLHEKGAQIEITGENGSTPLHAAVYNGAFYVSRLLIGLKASVEKADKNGWLPLTKAAAAGHLEILKLLLKAGPASIEWQDKFQRTPLHHAAANGRRDVVAYLLEMKAQIDVVDLNYETALHLASSLGHTAVAELLLQAGSDPEIPNKSKASVMHMASQLEHSDFIEQLLRMVPNIEIDPTDYTNSTPLHLAAMNGRSDTVRILLKWGADATARDIDNDLPMHLAAQGGHSDVVCQFMSQERLDARGFHERTPLYSAAQGGHIDVVQMLLDHGADANIADSSGFRPIYICLENGHEDIALLLLERGIEVDFEGSSGHNPLHAAARTGSETVVKALLEARCNARGLTAAQETPLIIALASPRHNIIDLLLEAAPETIHVANIRGVYPVHMAALRADLQSLDELIERGADLGSCDAMGSNALYYAAINGDIDVANRLLEHGVNVNGSAHRYQTPPLCIAAMSGRVDLIYRFLEITRVIECADTLTETTPLMWAAGYRRPTAVEVMLAAKANPFHRDAFGLNAIDYAIKHPETLAKFEAYMPGYSPLASASQQPIVRRTIIRFLKILLDLVEEIRPSKLVLRLHVTMGLGEALRHCADPDALDLSRICYISARCPVGGNPICNSHDCSICNIYLSAKEHFRCTVCHDVSLCSKCHASYVKGWETPRTAPEGFQKLEKLEKQLHMAIKTLRHAFSCGTQITGICINLMPSVARWFVRKEKAYEEWEATYNVQGDFKQRQRPGQECLKLLAEVRTSYSNTGAEDTENCRTEEEMNLVEVLDKKLGDFASTFRPDRRSSDFVCEGHEFMKISREEQQKFQANGDLDEKGHLAKDWLSTMLTRFQDNLQSDLDRNENSGNPDREADASKMIGEESPRTAEDRLIDLSEGARAKEESYQGIMEWPSAQTEQRAVSNSVARNTTLDIESGTGEILPLGGGQENVSESLSDTSGISETISSLPEPLDEETVVRLAIAKISMELGTVVLADGGNEKVLEDIERVKSMRKRLYGDRRSGEPAYERCGSQHDAADVGDKEIEESSATTSGPSNDTARNAETSVTQIADAGDKEIVESSATISDPNSETARDAETPIAQNADVGKKEMVKASAMISISSSDAARDAETPPSQNADVNHNTDVDSECAKDCKQAPSSEFRE